MKAVAAMSLNRVIGKNGGIPWHLPEDFRWFKEITSNGILLMGSKTMLSLGRPLPGRTHVVLSRDPARLRDEGAGFWRTADEKGWKVREEWEWTGWAGVGEREIWVLRDAKGLFGGEKGLTREVFLVGGAQLYGQLLGMCTDLYLSVVECEVEGDTFFPECESEFNWVATPLQRPEFHVRHYRRPEQASEILGRCRAAGA
jgi:dihydrofolate reductase